MAEKRETFLGMPVDKWFGFIERIGIPTAALFGIIASCSYIVGWVIAPPMVEGHLKLLNETTSSLKSMTEVQQQMANTLDKVGETSSDTDTFMEVVHEEHMTAEELIKDNGSRLDNVVDTLGRVHQAVKGN